MKRSSIITGICALAALIGAPGCQADTEIFVVITTDLQTPTSFTYVDIDVEDWTDPDNIGGGFGRTHWVVGGKEPQDTPLKGSAIRFPATQTLVAPADTNKRFLVTVSASKEENSLFPTLKTAKFVSPLSEGMAAVRFPLQFLCNDDLCKSIKPEDCCTENQVCRPDGKCGDPEDVRQPPRYEHTQVFGGGIGDGSGECFDAVGCFEGGGGPDFAPLKESGCTLTFAHADQVNNVGLVTNKYGACGFKHCYVPLDPGVWTPDKDDKENKTIKLPQRVCDWRRTRLRPDGVILGVVATTKGDAHCPKAKTVELPICSLASSTGGDTPYSVVIAKDEPHPVSIAVDGEGSVYWANAGVFDATTSTFQNGSVVKHLAKEGHDVGTVLATGAGSSYRDIALSGRNVLATDGTAGKITCMSPIDDSPGYSVADVVVGVGQPEGIAVSGSTVFWTQLDGAIRSADVGDCSGMGMINIKNVGSGRQPFRVVTYGEDACWTNEGTKVNNEGLPFGCSGKLAKVEELVTDLYSEGSTIKPPKADAPRGIAVYRDPVGVPVFGAFATFSSGNIFVVDMINLELTSTNIPETFWITGQAHPSGVAVDEGYVYWTNWGDGTVKRVSRHGCPNNHSTPELLAKGQNHPSGIVVTADVVYWVNEGSIGVSDGSVVARAKPAPGGSPISCF